MLKKFMSVLLLTLFSFSVFAADDENPYFIRRIAAFPIATDNMYSQVADQAWWKMREALTESRRFLIASKQFLQKKDVFQSRSQLKTADAVLLGKLLDAHALVITKLEKKNLTMKVYSGFTGQEIWSSSRELHPSLTVQDQLVTVVEKMVMDFISSLPYQGFVVIDPLIGKPIYEEGDLQLVKIDIGAKSGAQVGDPVQWVELQASNPQQPYFQGGVKSVVVAEGVVVKSDRETIMAEVQRGKDVQNNIKEMTLVNFPKEYQKLREAYSSDKEKSNLPMEQLRVEMQPSQSDKNKNKPLVTAVASVLNIVAMVLLAL